MGSTRSIISEVLSHFHLASKKCVGCIVSIVELRFDINDKKISGWAALSFANFSNKKF